ncbi:hypothetical protein HK098_007445 [Nowakowskiella sp. JEL0407]|nr:hypothetical protein HK098_007445 [Nowakowskiella sp. JEL0407]
MAVQPLSLLCVHCLISNPSLLLSLEHALVLLPDSLRLALFNRAKQKNILSPALLDSTVFFWEGRSVADLCSLPLTSRSLDLLASTSAISLSYLSLRFTNVTDSLAATCLKKLCNLKTLDLKGCSQVADKSCQSIASGPGYNLLHLNLSFTKATSTDLDISCTSISSLSPFFTTPPTNLVKLNISSLQLPNPRISELVESLQKLSKIYLGNANLNDDIVQQCFLGRRGLVCVVLTANPHVKSLQNVFRSLSSSRDTLLRLDLAGTSVKYDLPPSPPPDFLFLKLRSLSLEATKVGDDDVVGIVSVCPGVKELYLGKTHVSEVGVRRVMEVVRLEILDLTSCRGIPLKTRRELEVGRK